MSSNVYAAGEVSCAWDVKNDASSEMAAVAEPNASDLTC